MNNRHRNKNVAMPPQFPASIKVTHKIRFYRTITGAINVTYNDLLDLIFVATTASVGYRLADAIRVRKIEMWAAATAGGNTAIIIEDGAASGIPQIGGRSRVLQDMTVGSAVPAHLVWTPAKGSVQDSWINVGTSANFLSTTGPVNSILDLTFDIVIADGNQAPTLVASTFAGAVVGNVYTRAFGTSAAPTGYTPVGLAFL